MTIATPPRPKTGKHRSRKKFPWDKWLQARTAAKATKLIFGKHIPADKKPMVLTTQLHQWGDAFGLWVYTSVDHQRKFMLVYGVPKVEGKERPESEFPSPKKGTHHSASNGTPVAKKKATAKAAPAKAPKKSPKKAAKKAAKGGDCS